MKILNFALPCKITCGKKLIILVLLFISLLIHNISFAAIPPSERAALIALYESTNGDNWTNKSGWKVGDEFAASGSEHTWHGITLTGDNVTEISLDNNNLTGNIPDGIWDLVNLTILNLRQNSLSGNIPTAIGNLINVTELNLSGNELSGSIPDQIGNLVSLTDLHLEWNHFNGNIPSSIGNITSLRSIALYANEISGSIPDSIFSLPNLYSIDFAFNQLSGSIPSNIGNLINLSQLYLRNNQFNGAVPVEIGKLTNMNYLDLANNQLSGTIPEEIGNLTNLSYLYLSGNKFTGSIPVEIKNLVNLSDGNAYIEYNALYSDDSSIVAFLDSLNSGWQNTQTLPPQNVTTGTVTETTVQVQWSPVTYTADPGGYRVSYSTTLEGPYTYFGSTTSKSSTQMTVTGLTVGTTYYFKVQTYTTPHVNNHNTVISDYSQDAVGATVFDADNDGMSNDWEILYFGGILRDGTGDYDNDHLIDIDEYLNNTNPTLEDTDTDGMPDGWEIQNELNPLIDDASENPDGDNLTNIQEYQNNTDPNAVQIPLTERAALIALYNNTDGDHWKDNSGWKTPPLYSDGFSMPGTENNWHGVTTYSSYQAVAYIILEDNNLAGEIPSELAALNYLKILSLSQNRLTGSIPSILKNFHYMTDLAIGGNQFSGTIPAWLGNLENLEMLDLSNNQLTGTIPVELGDLLHLKGLFLSENQLTGNIPVELKNLGNLKYILLYHNQLSGSIPREIGSISSLENIDLSSNRFVGELPVELLNLSNLILFQIHHNALYTNNKTLDNFLNGINPDWDNSQTIAPKNVTAGNATNSSILVEWTTIYYEFGTVGGYMVYYSTVPGGPYTLFGTTSDKFTSNMLITGLTPGTQYYFVIQTKTDPNLYNDNTVISDYSEEATAKTKIDIDDDFIEDDWEILYFGNLSRNGSDDFDSDGLTDLNEYKIGTNPKLKDTDSDGIPDGDEDKNRNGIIDTGETDPAKADTDNDGMPDGWEDQYNLDPLVNDANEDSDGDHFSNIKEYQENTNPGDPKSHPPRVMPWLPLLLGD